MEMLGVIDKRALGEIPLRLLNFTLFTPPNHTQMCIGWGGCMHEGVWVYVYE